MARRGAQTWTSTGSRTRRVSGSSAPSQSYCTSPGLQAALAKAGLNVSGGGEAAGRGETGSGRRLQGGRGGVSDCRAVPGERPPAWPPPAMSRASGVHLTGTGLPGRSCRSRYLLESSLESLAGAQVGFRGAGGVPGRRRGSGAQHLRPLFHVLAAARHLTGAAPAAPATQSGSALEQSCACVPVKLREALF